MNRELIINVTSTEINIALCEDKVLVELGKDMAQTGFAVGDIYLGKVRKIMPGLNAAFVNIGHERDAFIHYQDLGTHFPTLDKIVDSWAPNKKCLRLEAVKIDSGLEKDGKISSYLKVGQSVMVQVSKEAISTKGPRLTCDISLAGRNIVLVPFSSKVFLAVIGGSDTGDGSAVTHLLGHRAAQKVEFVRLGNGDEQIGLFNTGLLQNAVTGAVAHNTHDIKATGQGLNFLGVLVHDDDIVAFLDQLFHQGAANLSAANNDDLQAAFFCFFHSKHVLYSVKTQRWRFRRPFRRNGYDSSFNISRFSVKIISFIKIFMPFPQLTFSQNTIQ